jgi:transcriptional regulator with XRE-family HTH domain
MAPLSRTSSKPASLCRLREWRTAQGLTLQVTADLTGYDISTISRVERGQLDLRPMARVEFARRLGVRLAEIFPVERR